ncbi:MAG TPA: PIN domain nuclease, partial [Taishania sp.]|nr:PIN domain nuclease [Taishania sp.]
LALTSNQKDFEDAIQYYTAIEFGMEIIITRNKKDFKNLNLPILTAKEFMNR